jgi:hypothetical protein
MDTTDLLYLEYPTGHYTPGNPVNTQWHALKPGFCTMYSVQNWRDNGDGKLSVCDYIKVQNVATAETSWYHVDAITVTLELNPTKYIDYTGPGQFPPKGFADSTIYQPLGTRWFEPYPNWNYVWAVQRWVDNAIGTPDGYLSVCDTLDLKRIWPQPSVVETYHVAAIRTDLVLKRAATWPIPTATQWGLIILVTLLVASAAYIMLRRKKAVVST